MPELRLVVLALQDRLAYGPTFESALAALFSGGLSSTSALATAPAPVPREPAAVTAPAASGEISALIADAARDLEEYQRLTAEGKLGEAGQRLEALKLKLEQLVQRPRD
jgi:uncharacterized membrane protein (UPF0182 family)